MALLKLGHMNDSGVSSEYWEIANYNVDLIAKYVTINIQGWVNKIARESNMKSVDCKQVICLPTLFEEYFADDDVKTICQIYKFAKENESFFMDSVDESTAIVSEDDVIPKKSNMVLLNDKIKNLQNDVSSTKEAIDFILYSY